MAHFCPTFLKPEMHHIHRQICALQRVHSVVLTRKRENASIFPWREIAIVPRDSSIVLRRLWYKNVRNAPIPISAGEQKRIENELKNTDLLHIYFGHVGLELLPLIQRLRLPVVVSFHGADAAATSRRHREQMRELFGLVTLVLVRSEALGSRVETLGCPRTKIRLNRTSVPLGQFSFQQRKSPPDGAWRVVQASRLIPKKGLHATLRAFAKFAAEFPHSQLTIAGEGHLAEELQALARELQITERVMFSGFLAQDELRELFYRSHLFIHPSEKRADEDQEGVPNSMLEAMATGLPVLATHHGGIPEAVEDGVSGFLVAERDHDALARAMIDMTRDAERYREMSAAAARETARRFGAKENIARLEDAYFEAINRA